MIVKSLKVSLLSNLLQDAKKIPEDRLKGKYGVQLQINRDNSGELTFTQAMEFVEKGDFESVLKEPKQFKTLHLLKCDFEAADESTIKHQIKFRNRVAKVELDQMEARLKQVCGVIEDLNPSLVQ